MKDAILFLKVFVLFVVMVVSFSVSFIFLYLLVSAFGDFALEKYMNFNLFEKTQTIVLVIIGIIMIIVPLLISMSSFKKLRKVYLQLSE